MFTRISHLLFSALSLLAMFTLTTLLLERGDVDAGDDAPTAIPILATATLEVAEPSPVVHTPVIEEPTPTAEAPVEEPTQTAEAVVTEEPTRMPPTSTPLPTPSPPVLDGALQSNFGSITLQAGFTPDPHQVAVTSGGSLSVNAMQLGANCHGMATLAPDYQLTWTGTSAEMRVFFAANNSAEDTTLIINDPNGNWHCSDDFDGRDPGLIFSQPAQGIYDIWVASYYDGTFVDGTLYISEYDLRPSDTTDGPNPILDVGLPPNEGSVSLAAGFLPDPYSIALDGGGAVDVADQQIGINCSGYATSAPDFELNWSGTSSEMRILFAARGRGDATIIVNDPNGNWHCSDDFDGLDPGIIFANPAQGVYDVWVGSFSFGTHVEGTLHITEYDLMPGDLSGQVESTLDYTRAPHYGEISLRAGFLPDPHSVAVTGGGIVDVDALQLGVDCYGYARSAPTYRLTWSGQNSDLTIYFTATDRSDATLIVNDPQGNWYCNDDWDGFDPGMSIGNAPPGQYDIWIGTFERDESANGTLSITEFEINR